jgi:hypothetical protein
LIEHNLKIDLGNREEVKSKIVFLDTLSQILKNYEEFCETMDQIRAEACREN